MEFNGHWVKILIMDVYSFEVFKNQRKIFKKKKTVSERNIIQ